MPYAVWSWDKGNRRWLSVSQGTLNQMHKAAEGKYAAARKLKVDGCAFYVSPESRPPTVAPEELEGVEVVRSAAHDDADRVPSDVMETVRVRVTWTSTHELRVPKGTRCPSTLAELMRLVEADPDSGGDITSETAELVDWEW